MAKAVFTQLKKAVQSFLEEGIAQPSDIQILAIPAILQSKNVLVIAPTGTGKTYAAILPVLQLFFEYREDHEVRGISILYITPLRALNRDVFTRLAERGGELG